MSQTQELPRVDPLPQSASQSVASTPSSINDLDNDDSEKKFICSHCNHTFTRKHNLKSHLLIHTQEKPFHCSICSSKFRRLHDLKRHEKLHTGEKPYQCKNCGRKFARMDALVRHNNSQSGCTLLVDDQVLKDSSIQSSGYISNSQQSNSGVGNHINNNHNNNGLINTPPSSSSTNQSSSSTTTTATTLSSNNGNVGFPLPSNPINKRSNYETSQWKINNTLPSINRLTPLINPIDQTPPPQQQPLLQQQQQQSSQQQIQSQQHIINEKDSKFDLLPYVRLLESRVSTLETKLLATETKLAQLTYNVHHTNQQSTQHHQQLFNP